ncbi:putative major facilitator superfamily, sugar transporter (TC 2.A.1.1) family protein [Lyophyllum shimeji]|uniref:Major facilitator superfamily, sugar transporter (TC 2.A.1.1) family protein n=1 Tax=Lyophyllum shimeji TaxID=47721 RepID=A0A9P3PZV9_LYOSH|nr:putative major facilitator superfamily, sugar transporter (TC 2.A.1.1) family protein [Lyophyllum shimeji]
MPNSVSEKDAARVELVQGAAAQRRAELYHGKVGVSALLKNKKALAVAAFASIGGFLYGYQQGVLGGSFTKPSFKSKFPRTTEATVQSLLTAILQIGGYVGSLTAGLFGEVFSRKHTILSGALWVVLGSFLCAGAENLAFLYAGRFFTGVGVGTLAGIGFLYNAELAPPEIRGILVAMQQLGVTFGIMVAYWIGYGTNFIGGTGATQKALAWQLPWIIQGIPAVVLAVGTFFMPYSPRLLVNKGRDAEAVSTLSYLRNLPEDHELIQIEFLDIKAEAIFDRRILEQRYPQLVKEGASIWVREIMGYANLFRTKDSFKRTAIAGIIMFFQQWTGIDSIIYYAPFIFENLGLSSNSVSLLATGVVGVIMVFASILSMVFIDTFGRKPLWIASCTGMGLSMLIVGIITAKFSSDWPAHAAGGWAAVVFVWIYIANFAYGAGPVSWTLISEIFPLSTRAKGTAIGATSNWANTIVVAYSVPPMIKHIGFGTYILFASFNVLSIIFVYFFVPETKGKTLEEMDLVFGSHTSRAETAMLAGIQNEVGLTALLHGHRKAEGTKSSTEKTSEGDDVAV